MDLEKIEINDQANQINEVDKLITEQTKLEMEQSEIIQQNNTDIINNTKSKEYYSQIEESIINKALLNTQTNLISEIRETITEQPELVIEQSKIIQQDNTNPNNKPKPKKLTQIEGNVINQTLGMTITQINNNKKDDNIKQEILDQIESR